MSEQEIKPASKIKDPKPNKGKNAFGERITLGEDDKKEKPVKAEPRKKVTITSEKMHVDIPGELRGGEAKTPSKPATQPKTPAVKPKAETPKLKSPAKPAKKGSAPKDQRKINGASKGKASPAKKSAVPAKEKPPARAKVVPPKIGTRRGYRASLAFRLRFPVFFSAFVVCALALFFAFRREAGPVGRYVVQALEAPSVELTIKAGMSARSVSLLLREQGIVDDDQALLQFFIDNNIATILRSGTFVMEKGMDYETIGRQLTARVGEIVLEISPSFTLEAIDRYLKNRGYAEGGSFLQAAEALKEKHSLSFVEGWLLSGEYVVSQDDVAKSLAQAMFDAMLKLVQPQMGSGQVAQWGLEQILIVVSMIQAETQNVEEMPLIASVIYNRLEAGHPLGIDATTRYELDDWENPIPTKALETQTPYNTRRKVGLPPSGICSPSKAAVEAALYPLESPYFYYLHGLDKRLYPAVTYDEHKDNIKAYR
jgi:UPF0755 protein